MANEDKMVYGSPITVISHAATLANGANTYTGLSGCTMTELNNSSAYPYARAVLNITDTFAAAPTAGGGVELWMMRNDVDSTTDCTPVPAVSDLAIAESVGWFPIAAQDVAHIVSIIISLEDVVKANFFIKNACGQTISYASTATTVKITPFTHGPA